MAQTVKRKITQEDIWLMRRVGNPVASPDGNWLVTSVIEPAYDPAEEFSDIWLVAADGSAPPDQRPPIRYVQNFSTPTLVSHGERDFRVPLGEGLANFKLLQRRKIPTRFIVFPDEGHMISNGENARLYWQEVSAWLARFL